MDIIVESIVMVGRFMNYLIIAIVLLVLSGCGLSAEVNSNQRVNLEEHIQQSTNNIMDSNLEKAKQFLSNGDYNKAIDAANNVIASDPNSAEAYSIRGFARALNGEIEQGLVDTKTSYQLDPNNVANYYNMAMVYKLAGQLEESKQWFEKVLTKDPNNTWSIYGIATIYADQGDDDKALEWLAKAIRIDASVKVVAAEQDHFERFHENSVFKSLVLP